MWHPADSLRMAERTVLFIVTRTLARYKTAFMSFLTFLLEWSLLSCQRWERKRALHQYTVRYICIYFFLVKSWCLLNSLPPLLPGKKVTPLIRACTSLPTLAGRRTYVAWIPNKWAYFGGVCTVQLLLVLKGLGLCLIRRHWQDFYLQRILGESQIIFV